MLCRSVVAMPRQAHRTCHRTHQTGVKVKVRDPVTVRTGVAGAPTTRRPDYNLTNQARGVRQLRARREDSTCVRRTRSGGGTQTS